jgi:arylsulfatase A-like enzyme
MPPFKPLLMTVMSLKLLATSSVLATESLNTDGDSHPLQPNILLVVADDLAYSDLGSFGGEIATPNIDHLAKHGIRLTNVYAAAACSPSRSMLMTGVDHHLAGLGNMAERIRPTQEGRPGYEGYLNSNVASVAERLGAVGYRTYIAGKWHLGKERDQSPFARGFDRSYVLLEGGGNHYNRGGMFPYAPISTYREDGKVVELEKEFYSSKTYTDKLITYLDEQGDTRSPFFAYLAYTAPHWPLQAPRSVIEKYHGVYDKGYDDLREKRARALQDQGLIDQAAIQRLDSLPDYRPWRALSPVEKAIQSRTMEVYAAMVEEMDRHLGRVLSRLKETGDFDNTLIIFVSDNGAEGKFWDKHTGGTGQWIAETFDNRLENIGNESSYVYLGPGWASATMAPFYQVKRSASEGGIRVPAIIHCPRSLDCARGDIPAVLTVKDIAATLMAAGGVETGGTTFEGRSVQPVTGREFLTLLTGERELIYSENEALVWELFGHRAVRKGDWKLVSLRPPFGDGVWRLYDLENDPFERRDVSQIALSRVSELIQEWKAFEVANGVVLPE